MEIACIFRDSINHWWSYDNQYYSLGGFNDGDGCSSSSSYEVLESINKDS